MAQDTRLFLKACAVLVCVKLLLFPAYSSTDLEVHRHWLATTHNLPLEVWYTDTTSVWTLDYPPFFALLEWLLSFPAAAFDPSLVQLSADAVFSPAVLLFQRASVVATDLFYFWGVFCVTAAVAERIPKAYARYSMGCTRVLLLSSPALLMIDSIHFQYNGIVCGVLFLATAALLRGRLLLGAVLFSACVNLKHISLYVAPGVALFLLLAPRSLAEFCGVALATMSTFALSLIPFVATGQLRPLLSRLFPFGRGLTHSYWAPNFWALYNTADRILMRAACVFGWEQCGLSQGKAAPLTRGLVGVDQATHDFLPCVSASQSLATVCLSLVPLGIGALLAARKLRGSLSKEQFLLFGTTLAPLCFFLFGYHVHEKAIVHVLLPLQLAAAALGDPKLDRLCFVVTVAGHVSLFPLLFRPEETAVKVLLTLTHAGLQYLWTQPQCRWVDAVYLTGLCAVVVVQTLGAALLPTLTFLPLLLTSVWTALPLFELYARLVVLCTSSRKHG